MIIFAIDVEEKVLLDFLYHSMQGSAKEARFSLIHRRKQCTNKTCNR